MGDTDCKKQPVENIEDYNTVRISCHGEYNTEQTVIANTSHSISNPIIFHIFFRAKPGQCVLARTQSIRLENQDFGANTYTKEFIISTNRDNYTDKAIEYLQTDKNIPIPDINLHFNTSHDEERMYLGYTLYKTNDCINFIPKVEQGLEQFKNESKYSMHLISTGNSLIYALWNIYKNTRLTDINVYISCCLDLDCDETKIASKKFTEWFYLNKDYIQCEYEKNHRTIIGDIHKLQSKLDQIDKMDPDLLNDYNKLEFFIRVLNDDVEELKEYVQEYIESYECKISEIDEMIDDNRDDFNEDAKELTKHLVEGFTLEKNIIESFEADRKMEIQKLTNEMKTKNVELENLMNSLQVCSIPNSKPQRYNPYGGGKKKKITIKKGALTKQAKSHGYKDVMKFARLTMRLHKRGKKKYQNGKRITKLLVKRSNFAVNFNKKK